MVDGIVVEDFDFFVLYDFCDGGVEFYGVFFGVVG